MIAKGLRDLVSDLINDYRCALRDGFDEYAEMVHFQIHMVFNNRHNSTVNLDRYGWPRCLQRKEW